MAKETDDRSHNQPSHEASVKGGEHSHQGSHKTSTSHQQQQGTSEKSEKEDGRSHNQPSHEAQVKGGQHSHSGSQK
jgi:hypothetical protein